MITCIKLTTSFATSIDVLKSKYQTHTLKMETVLVIGATGNIGVAAILGALRSNRNVLALVRNQVSVAKLFQHVGTHEGITIVEADIMSDQGVQSVVDQVRASKLPAFQHVYSAGEYPPSPPLNPD